MKVRWSERARAQVREIFEYIAHDRPGVAERILDGFLERARVLAEFPKQGTAWGDPRRSDLRSIIYESYRVVYRIGGDEISVLSVRHTRMRPDEPTSTEST